MKFLHQCLVLGSIASLATSCSQDAPWKGANGDEGRLTLDLKTDFSVATSTRANDSESPVKPDGDRFRIKLENSDGSYSKEWENLNKFNEEEGFPKGNYTVTAYYGAESEQGFTNPHYVGTQNVTIVAGEVTEHSVTATLANSMVSVRYTDSFKDHFTTYSSYLESEGISTPQIFTMDETRPCYVKPGEINVSFRIPSPEGQEVTVTPAKFTAQPRRHYIVTANVVETVTGGKMALVVEFDDNVVSETTEIVLDDELFSAPAPEIQASGFGFGEQIETFESVNLSVNPEFHVIAPSGIKEAKLKVETSTGKLPAFGSEIDLANADDVEQQLVEASKLKCFGLFRQPASGDSKNQMAVVNMKEFIENLDPGDYTVSLSIVDEKGQSVQAETPCSFKTKVNSINFKLEQDSEPTKFMSDEIAVVISTTYHGAKDILSFLAEDKDGNLKKASIKSHSEIESTDPEFAYAYRYVLGVDNINDLDCRVEAVYPKKSGIFVDVPITVPAYEVEVDAFAKRAILKIIPENPEDLNILVNEAKLYWENGQDVVKASQISRDADNGLITVTGLEPGREYNSIGLSYGMKISSHCTPVTFTTEAATDVPNGDFSQATQRIHITGLQVGGQYNVSPANYTLKSSIDRYIPDGWTTINALTCYEGSTNKNTWFLVPSTYEDGGMARIQNVGYNHAGTTPARSGGAFNTKYYCENAPTDNQLNKAAGELFLGSYSFDGTAHRVDGISFTSRPDKLEFDYSYAPCNDDKGIVEVKIFDASGKVLAEGSASLSNTNNTTRHGNISLKGYGYSSKAATIQIRFRSSESTTPPIVIPSGSALSEGKSLGNHTLDPNTYHAFAIGSVLLVDNVHLLYE